MLFWVEVFIIVEIVEIVIFGVIFFFRWEEVVWFEFRCCWVVDFGVVVDGL